MNEHPEQADETDDTEETPSADGREQADDVAEKLKEQEDKIESSDDSEE